ncbi:MAG: VapC toxin family PIN domain ribonuclease [Devosia sp. 67-54]|uniref:type II toxin-antitoxin system VapC family toxin n=1 Tax=unclassified Devosia TaxID=196773 RepID=UPI00095BDCBE|nr:MULTISPECIES: type II toxin-antitoxin system VapC family toxin [unclassified Devosia]MBN9304214.1 type II toxin-antitoxin system VapC family toxin [Devosia sp.]OJX18031.1 MAG: VapC toxin family PIN domain ribonuclease [Devosia sp. 67-54]
MRTVDTSAWIEWLLDSPTGAALEAELPPLAEWIVPTIVQLELSKWLVRERGEAIADRAVALTQRCVVVPLDTPIALIAAEMCALHGLSTADAIIYASASEHRADLLTCDAHFKDLPGVVYVAKRSN